MSGNDARSAAAATRSVRAKPELSRDLIALPEAPARRNRRSKGERLRQLTDRLRQHSSLDEVDHPPTPPLHRPHARAVVGSYIQRSIPFRSASFSLGEIRGEEDAECFEECMFGAVAEEAWAGVGLPPAPDAMAAPPPLTYSAVVVEPSAAPTQSQTPLLDRLACMVKSKSFDSDDASTKQSRAPGSPDIRVDDVPTGAPTDSGEWSWATVNDGDGRLAPLSRNDSLSEGEAEFMRMGRASPGSPRRYNKRPLRGPYGQMLEAEMKRASPAKLGRELGFLEALVASPEAAAMMAAAPASAPATPLPPPPRRKISAYQMSSDKGSSSGSSSPMVQAAAGGHVHQRAASSPCQLMANPSDDADRSRDTRTHVVVELFETEKSYVEAMKTLVTKYLNPLKNSENLVESYVVDEIFFQIPSILQHHEAFLEELQKRLDTWDLRQKIGDLFLDFSRQSVVECYTAFINNWQQAKSAISNACHSKPAFARFLEATSREHKGKLALDSLLIMPVQRIPRYELLIQTLLKHTSSAHPDHSYLVSAQRAIHDLAMTINCRERESCEAEQNLQHLRELENLLDGCGRLAVPDRNFLRHDAVTATIAGSSKERMLFLFSDMLIIASVKRRSGTIRKPSSSSLSSSSVTSNLDANKYKTLMKFSLTDLDMVKARDEAVRHLLQEIAEIAEDCNLISRLMDVAGRLHCSHSSLDETLRDMQASLSRQLLEKQVGENGLNCLELSIGSQCENVALVFGKPEQREAWEEAFTEAKQKLVLSAEQRPSPEFLYPLAIRKTRAGLQFTCAAATAVPRNADYTSRDVWVCNSDGYVGQVCILSLHTEPTVISCNGVCNSRILCIAAIPAPSNSLNSSNVSENYETVGSRHNNVQDKRLHFESSSTSSEDYEVDEGVGVAREAAPEGVAAATAEEAQQLDESEPSMWLGTEDGFIHVYASSDSIRVKKNKIKMHHGSSVHCILYLENRVYASLANGDIVIYTRDANNQWNTIEPYYISVGSSAMPVSKMVCVGSGTYIWCACHNNVRILNTITFQVECALSVGNESERAIHCLVSVDLAVWISLHNSASVRLYHGISMDLLCEVSVAPAVTKMLATGCDDIIRQHKAACLRVTALLACHDLLWVGTSAGVILTIPIPHLTVATGKLPAIPTVIGVPHGHTGHVRFLTSVQVEKGASGGAEHSSSQKAGGGSGCRTLVISGGDGYEDFRSSSLSEIAGREDSTNHLLLWRV